MVGPSEARVVLGAEPNPGGRSSAPEDVLTSEPDSYSPLGDSMQLFLNEVSRYRLLTPAEELGLARRVECGDKAAKDRMINANLRLVVSIAKRYQHVNMALLD